MAESILIPVDYSEAAEKTVATILGNPSRFQQNVTLLHVIDVDKLAYRMIPEFQVEMVRERALASGRTLLDDFARRFADLGIATNTRLEQGTPRVVIGRVANDENFDLLIIARRNTGEIRDVLFGSVANYVLHHVRCPVLLI
jgi:nucleotide-binding universal stress UspA family protein